MLATAIIVFREVLEAGLIVGVVLAASQGIPHRLWWVGLGIAGGSIGAALVAAFAGSISSLAQGVGQELFNAVILFAAVAMLGWHTVWMGRHGREMAERMHDLAAGVALGRRPPRVLPVIVGVAVLREGSEIALFLYGIALAGGDRSASMLVGGLLGLAAGIAIGVLLYRGLLTIPARHLFGATNALIVLLAAGMAAQGADFLVQAGVLPPLVDHLWDTSAVLSDHSLIGRALHTLTGYVDRPSGMQLTFYLATGAILVILGRLAGRAPRRGPARLAAAE
jgi:high-affinity iron transporter